MPTLLYLPMNLTFGRPAHHNVVRCRLSLHFGFDHNSLGLFIVTVFKAWYLKNSAERAWEIPFLAW